MNIESAYSWTNPLRDSSGYLPFALLVFYAPNSGSKSSALFRQTGGNGGRKHTSFG